MDKINGGPNSKKIWVLLGLVALIIVITVIAAYSGKNKKEAAAPTQEQNPAAEDQANAPKSAIEQAKESNPALKDARADLPGGVSLITKDETAVNLEGKELKSNAAPTSLEAPQQTAPIKDTASLPSQVAKISVSLGVFEPKEFTVKRGAAVSIAITSKDQFSHIFKFEDPSLSAVAVGLSPNETRGMTFNAPDKAGEYKFFCDVPGHAGRGEVGKMIVK